MQDPTDAGLKRGSPETTVCTYLGQEGRPSSFLAEPSPRHRCYFRPKGDSIDLAHQARFCFTESHSVCQWPAVCAQAEMRGTHHPPPRTVDRGLTQKAPGWGLPFVPAPQHWLRGVWSWMSQSGVPAAPEPSNAPIGNPEPAVRREDAAEAAALGTALPVPSIPRRVPPPRQQDEHAELALPVPPTPESPEAAGAPQAPPASALTLVDDGIEVLNAGDEEAAYHLFAAATRLSPDSEPAWRLRAKTAATLDEVIACLEQVCRLNPADVEVRKALNEALQRNGQGTEATQGMVTPGAPAAAGSHQSAESVPDEMVNAALRSMLLQVAGVCAFASALALTVPVLVHLGGMDTRPEFGALLAMFPRTRVMLTDLGLTATGLPVFDMGGAVSFVLGLLLLPGAFGIVSGGGLSVQVRIAGLLAATVILMVFFGANPPVSSLAAVISAVGVAAALAGKAQPQDPGPDGWVRG